MGDFQFARTFFGIEVGAFEEFPLGVVQGLAVDARSRSVFEFDVFAAEATHRYLGRRLKLDFERQGSNGSFEGVEVREFRDRSGLEDRSVFGVRTDEDLAS